MMIIIKVDCPNCVQQHDVVMNEDFEGQEFCNDGGAEDTHAEKIVCACGASFSAEIEVALAVSVETVNLQKERPNPNQMKCL